MVTGEGIKNAVEIREDRLSERRHVRNILRRSDASDLWPLPSDGPSRVFPPAGGYGGDEMLG